MSNVGEVAGAAENGHKNPVEQSGWITSKTVDGAEK